MKSIKLFLAALLLLSSCTDTEIYFTESQPEKKKALKSIPSAFLGEYNAPSDSTFLYYFNDTFNRNENEIDLSAVEQRIVISDKHILNKMNGQAKLIGDPNSPEWANARDNKAILDTLILSQFGRPTYNYKLLKKDPSELLFEVELCDTLFSISGTNEIKKWKGIAYLNIEKEEDKWSAFQMNKISDDILEFKSISKEDIEILRRVLKKNLEYSEDDIIHISAKSFKEFIELGGFEESIILPEQ